MFKRQCACGAVTVWIEDTHCSTLCHHGASSDMRPLSDVTIAEQATFVLYADSQALTVDADIGELHCLDGAPGERYVICSQCADPLYTLDDAGTASLTARFYGHNTLTTQTRTACAAL
ncbi:hypothetical protein [Alteromonas sp. CYL-A6]|uniref:hypothetical protein n=1 Tax=Alteromonas nitratireducens TaxID=3390813 RepID=UPI0034AD7180